MGRDLVRLAQLPARLLVLSAAARALDQGMAGWPGGKAQVMSHSPGGRVPATRGWWLGK